MTKKDYELIAKVIRNYFGGPHGLKVERRLTIEFADAFEKDNSRFNRETFLKACQP